MENNEKIQERERLDVVDFESAKKFLFERLSDSEKKLFSQEQGIVRAETWLETLGNPQESYPSIHIAGTSGKGSTTYMLGSMLKAMGETTGMIVSPHVYDVRERMMIDGEYIFGSEFAKRTKELIKPIADLEKTPLGRPIYFEVLVGMAHRCFADKKVNYAVVETGMGGKFDPTNTIKRSDKLAVITRLGLDHTQILGDTLDKIAWQKAGIIPKDGHAIALLPEYAKVKKVIEDVAKSNGSTIEFVNPKLKIKNLNQTIDGIEFDYRSEAISVKNISIPTLGKYQAENAVLAISAVEYLSKRDKLEADPSTLKDGLANTHIPARAEVRDFQGTPIILDSAHNPQKLEAFFGHIADLKLPIKPLVIFASKGTKDWNASLPIINSHADKVFVTSFFLNQPGHLKEYSADPDEIAQKITKLGGMAQAFSSPAEALKSALSSATKNQPIIITGSMYMLGELHDQLLGSC